MPGPALEAHWQDSAQKHGIVGEAHLFLELLESDDEILSALLAASGVSREEAQLYAQSTLESGPLSAEEKTELTKSANQAIYIALQEAQKFRDPQIEPHHLLIACVSHRRGAHLGQVLRPLGLDANQLRAHLRAIKANQTRFTPSAEAALDRAQAAMRASFCGRIAPAHLLLALLEDEEIGELLERAGCAPEVLRKQARESVKSDNEIAMPQKRFSPGAKRALERAGRAAKGAGRKRIDCEDLLVGLLPQRETLSEKWRARGRELDSVDAIWVEVPKQILRSTLGISLIATPPAPVQERKGLQLSQILAIATSSAILVFLHTLFFSDPSEIARSALQNTVLNVGLKLIPLLIIYTCVMAIREWFLRRKQVN